MKDTIHIFKLCDVVECNSIAKYYDSFARPSAEHLAHYICEHSEGKLKDLIISELMEEANIRTTTKGPRKLRIDVSLDVDITAREVAWDWVHNNYAEAGKNE